MFIRTSFVRALLVLSVSLLVHRNAIGQERTDSTLNCTVPALQLARLSPRAQCYIRTFQHRCNPSSACMIRCISQGAGQNIAGGCWHICFAYTGLPWEEPSALGECPRSEARPPAPKPRVSCQTGFPKPTLEIHVVADSAGVPIPGASIMVSDPARVFMADSAGRVLVDTVRAGNYALTIRALGYQAQSVAGVDLKAHSRCQVSVRMLYYWDEGF